MNEHEAQQIHAARKHSSQREAVVRAAIGEPGGLKHLLQRFAITIPEGENTALFLEHYESMDWEMDCQGCSKKSTTSFHKGRLLCPTCIDSAQDASGR